jgi:hypothetical protein
MSNHLSWLLTELWMASADIVPLVIVLAIALW